MTTQQWTDVLQSLAILMVGIGSFVNGLTLRRMQGRGR